MADENGARNQGLPIPRGYEEDSGDAKLIRIDPDMGGLLVANHVYNTGTGAWEKMQQPIITVDGDLTVTMGDVEKLLAEYYWLDKRFDWTSGDLDYLGFSTTHKASTSTGNLWYIMKFTWSSGNPTRIEGPLVGNWDGRAALSWGA